MVNKTINQDNEKLVSTYFSYIRELRSGVEGAVEKLMSLWIPDGTFEFAGSPPVVGTFRGRVAIEVLYRNRFKANGMPLTLEADSGKASKDRHAALGIVDTEVHHTRQRDDRIVAGWTTVVGAEDGRGFQVAGSHTFEFRDGRISSLRIVVSPRPEVAKDLKLEELGIEDIGRLALAAWAVV
jgi:ketosteroid isomerase-like protein